MFNPEQIHIPSATIMRDHVEKFQHSSSCSNIPKFMSVIILESNFPYFRTVFEKKKNVSAQKNEDLNTDSAFLCSSHFVLLLNCLSKRGLDF